jgi:hypothetical protein
MSQLIITRGNSIRRGFRHSTLTSHVQIGTFSLMIILVVFVCIMSIMFLVHYNNMATKGYVLKKLDVERQKLITEQEIKDMHLAEVRSLEAIQTRTIVAKMVNMNEPQFVREDTGIASR